MRRALALLLLFAASAQAGERPRLGVVLIVDQLSADSFEAKLPRLKGGLRRLANDGLVFHQLRYETAPTVTSAGHATLATGAYADVHGVPANEWIDWETGRPRLCDEDPAYAIVGRPPARDGTAPTWLSAPTLSESLKAKSAPGKSVVISGKDRSAIMSAGRAADAVLWFDGEKPFFTTSTFYAEALPPWVAATNDRIAELVLKRAFEWAPPGAAAHDKPADAASIQPLLDRFQVDLALAAVQALALGQDEVPDLLTVSFSSNDRIGHRFGPDAPEALRQLESIDREVGRLLGALDKAVGKGRYVVLFTSDHGAPPSPEVLKPRHLDAGHLDTAALQAALEKEADAALGHADWFAGYKTPGYFAQPAQRAKLQGAWERLRKVAREQPGVADLLPFSEVQKPGAFGSLGELLRHGLVAGRSPDFLLVPKPYWVYSVREATGHSSPHLYDRAVPLIFAYGPVKRGQAGEAEAIDVAPTLARLLGIPTPALARGHSIEAVFR